MKPAIAVVDTNVVVAGPLTRDLAWPVTRVLDGMLAGRFAYLLSPALLREYREVPLRPAIASGHRLTPVQVDAVLREFVANAR